MMSMTKSTRDPERTKAAILRAAQIAFSTSGYAASGVREITAMAGVNPALVSRYFGSKEKLFEAALADLLDINILIDQPRDRFGEGLVASFVDERADRVNPLQIMVLATSDAGARAIADRLVRELTIKPLANWFHLPNAEERAARIVVLASGFFVYRLLYPLDAWAGDIAPASRKWLEETFQSVVDRAD
jgi:AcrR family transcriptional regulator